MTTFTRRTLVLAAALAASFGAVAQSNSPVRITSVFPTASGPDTVTRLVAEKLQAKWQRPVVVEPRPGGAGVVAINAVKNAPPTGNELVIVDVGNLSINPLIFKNLSYDPEKDLVPVALIYKGLFFVTVSTDSPFKTMKDLMAAAGEKGRKLSFGSNAVGGPLHLHGERIGHAMGADTMHVAYKEISQLYTAVATRELDWALGSVASAGPLLRANKLRFLAVADKQRSAAMPDVPTMEEAGGPKDLYAQSWVAMMAPKGTPANVVADINKAVNEALAQPDIKEKLGAFGFAISPGPAQQVVELMQGDRARYADVVKRVRVSVD